MNQSWCEHEFKTVVLLDKRAPVIFCIKCGIHKKKETDGLIKHKATQARKKLQLDAFFSKLKRNEKGRLTKESRQKRDDFLSAFGITNERARQIMKGDK